MATPQIGSLTFEVLTGRVMPLAGSVEDHTRPGVDGHESVLIGSRAPTSELRTVKRVATAAAMKTQETNSAALKAAAPVTVTYSDAQTMTNVQVVDVVTTEARLAGVIAGAGSGSYVIRQLWTVRQIA